MNLDSLIARFKSSAAALSGRQLLTLTVAFVAVVALTIWSAYSLNTPSYGVLFSDMDSEAASSVVSKLKNAKVQYVLDDGGGTIRVPTDRIDELRLEFASDGMPSSGRMGFELFDRTAFGVTDFLEHVNYRRALEGELARTISTIREVAGARVHIALPQPSLFVGQEQPTKASVVLKLRQNQRLQPATVNAITGLMAASVESLRPESVVIIDNYGRPLSTQEQASEADGVPLERQQRIEQDMTTRLVALLEPIVGPGRVRINVSAKLNSDTQELTEERWDPNPVIRSRQSVSQSAAGATTLAQAVPAGARSNLPPEPPPPGEPAAGATPPVTVVAASAPGSHMAETTNYEVGKVTTHSLKPRGDIARLSVAVLVDNERPADEKAQPAPRKPEEIQKIHGLVAAAVGLDMERGDQLTVENIAFEEAPVEEIAAPTFIQQYAPQALEVGRILGIVAIGLVALLFVIRPTVRSLTTRSPAAQAATGALPVPRTVEDLEAEIDAQLAGATVGQSRRMPVLTKRVAALTEREPENAARLLRTWLSESER
ncbi:MAG TPA: flagellar basal-body MS-ring/collar protein FliF [Vicinamibacterales bacterium]|nr:flagellar basal-body MS-ring/collar protein FliF [Vicinamibacterales bacterium]